MRQKSMDTLTRATTGSSLITAMCTTLLDHHSVTLSGDNSATPARPHRVSSICAAGTPRKAIRPSLAEEIEETTTKMKHIVFETPSQT